MLMKKIPINKILKTRAGMLTTIIFLLFLAVPFIYSFIHELFFANERPILVWKMQSSSNHLIVQYVYTTNKINQYIPPAIKNETIFTYIPPSFISRNGVVSLDAITDTLNWQSAGCTDIDGGSDLIVHEQEVIVTGALGIYACKISDGTRIWSKQLGYGHVSVVPQLDVNSSILRVYYGESIFELDPASGDMINKQPIDNILWIVNQVVIYQYSDKYMGAKDRVTGLTKWENHDKVFSVSEWRKPQLYDNQSLIVFMSAYVTVTPFGREVCLFNYITGNYAWCRPEKYISHFGIIEKEGIGYILRDDFVLVKVNLRTGEVLDETSFSPNHLPENGQQYGYFVEVTRDNTILVYFGDSQQLFGLKEK